HHDEHATLLYPVGDVLYMRRFNVIRRCCFLRRIWIDNDVDIRTGERPRIRRDRQTLELRTEAGEYLSPCVEAGINHLVPLVVPDFVSAVHLALADLVIEIVIEEARLSTTGPSAFVRLHLKRRLDRRSKALRIVQTHLLAHVVV